MGSSCHGHPRHRECQALGRVDAPSRQAPVPASPLGIVFPPGTRRIGHLPHGLLDSGGSGPTPGVQAPERVPGPAERLPAPGGVTAPPQGGDLPPFPVSAQAPLRRRGEGGGVGRKGRGRSHLGAAIGSTQPGGAGRPRAPAKAFRAGTGVARRSGWRRRRRLALTSSPLPPLRERGLGLGLGGRVRSRSRSAMEARTARPQSLGNGEDNDPGFPTGTTAGATAVEPGRQPQVTRTGHQLKWGVGMGEDWRRQPGNPYSFSVPCFVFELGRTLLPASILMLRAFASVKSCCWFFSCACFAAPGIGAKICV
ncbi:uncharacterized protein ACIBXB_018822 [Morphnus guianensis]